LHKADRVIFVAILVLAGLYTYATEQLPSLEIGDPLGPKAFPRLLTVCLVITAIILLFEMIRGRKAAAPKLGPAQAQETNATYLVVAGVVVWTFLYVLVFEFLGFVIATIIYLFALTSYFHPGKWLTNALTCVAFCLGAYFMFQVLGVNLARGIAPF